MDLGRRRPQTSLVVQPFGFFGAGEQRQSQGQRARHAPPEIWLLGHVDRLQGPVAVVDHGRIEPHADAIVLGRAQGLDPPAGGIGAVLEMERNGPETKRLLIELLEFGGALVVQHAPLLRVESVIGNKQVQVIAGAVSGDIVPGQLDGIRPGDVGSRFSGYQR